MILGTERPDFRWRIYAVSRGGASFSGSVSMTSLGATMVELVEKLILSARAESSASRSTAAPATKANRGRVVNTASRLRLQAEEFRPRIRPRGRRIGKRPSSLTTQGENTSSKRTLLSAQWWERPRTTLSHGGGAVIARSSTSTAEKMFSPD